VVIRNGQQNLQHARQAQLLLLQANMQADPDDVDAPMRVAKLQNEIAQAALEAQEEVPMSLTESEKTLHSNAWRTYRERKAKLDTHRGQCFSLILGQCTQLLQDNIVGGTPPQLRTEELATTGDRRPATGDRRPATGDRS